MLKLFLAPAPGVFLGHELQFSQLHPDCLEMGRPQGTRVFPGLSFIYSSWAWGRRKLTGTGL